MTALPASARFTVKPGVIVTDLQHELVLLDPETQQMFRLNQTGRTVWRHLGTRDVGGLTDAVVEAFAVSAEQAGPDVETLLQDLLAAGLIVAAPGDRDR